MLRIVIFDTGWGGELVADYLENELSVVEIIRVIDQRHAADGYNSAKEAVQSAKTQLHDYIGKTDLIVLGGYTVSLALDELTRLYPDQAFVGMGINYYRVLKTSCPAQNVAILLDKTARHEALIEEIRHQLPESLLFIPDCSNWDKLIDDGEMNTEILRRELAPHFQLMPAKKGSKLVNETASVSLNAKPVRVDTVLLLDTHYFDIKDELEELFGYHARVMDFRQKLLHDVCFTLGLLGVDGGRSH